MNPTAKRTMQRELRESKNLRECFSILDKYYELENVTPGIITKSILIHKLEEAVGFMKAVPRKQFK